MNPNTADEPAAPATPSPLLVDAREVARLLDVSLASIWRWRSAGKLPAPIRIGATLRWRRDAIEAWVNEGCPESGR